MSSPFHDQDQDDEEEEEEDQESQQHSLHQPLLFYRNHHNNYNYNLQYHLPNATSQVALVGANVCPIESLDYEIIENDFFKQDWRTRGKTQMYQYLFMKWALCFLVGLILSLVGFFVNLAVENVAGIKFVFTSNLMLARRYALAFLLFTASNMALILFASSITSLIAPAAAGSGIPEVKAYLNGVDAPAIFSPKTLVVKIVGSISAVSASLLTGKAGPMVHAGASIASLLGQGGSKKYGLTWKWLHYFKNDRDRRDLVTCGAAAGIAAAFRSPVGGLLFALEEMASWWRSALLWRAFFSTTIVAIMLRGFVDFCYSGKCGLFGTGGLIMYNVTSENVVYHFSDIPIVLVLGGVGGVLGSLHNYLLQKLLRVYNMINEKGLFFKIFLACSISLFTSCLLFGLPWLASCQACPTDSKEVCPTIGRSGNYKKFQCAEGNYNDLASLIFNTNDDAIRNLFSGNTDSEFHGTTMVAFFVSCFFLSIISYGIVLPAGAAYGRYVGMLMGSKSSMDHGLYAVLGAASLLGGTMRTTVSLGVILLELTNNLLLLPLVMLVLLVSKTVADAFNRSIYDLIIKLKGFPYLATHVEPYMRQLTVSEVVAGPLQYFHGMEKVGNIVHVLRKTRHNGFPVVDEPPYSEELVLFGLILRTHLIVLLKKKAFLTAPVSTGIDSFQQFTPVDFAKRGSGKTDMIEDIDLTDEEMEMFIDLHPFTNASPYTVVETMSLAKALILFREVGLRHLLIIPKYPGGFPVAGILTRHDFMPEHILGLHPALASSRWKRLRASGQWAPGYMKCHPTDAL
ncbi:putative chloride channel-like protein [Drosera capensis]